MVTYILDIEPQPYVRRTHQGRYSEKAMQYHRYLNNLRDAAIEAGIRTLPDSGISVVFYISMPDSWSKKKKAKLDGYGHQLPKKFDLSNLLKSFEDALRPGDDGNIWHYGGLEKRWAYEGHIRIELN